MTVLYRLIPGVLAATLLLPAPSRADTEARARELLNAQGCKGCHRFEGSGGNRGPDLTHIGERLSVAQIRQHLQDPRSRKPDSAMPPFDHLPESALDALATFLAGRR